ncbi:MAG: tetratricopeptide repeat protein [Phycisphaerales bacterium]|nr:MAG: tetratricopeptide repeat protein [Phycisphaerales bacterium]
MSPSKPSCPYCEHVLTGTQLHASPVVQCEACEAAVAMTRRRTRAFTATPDVESERELTERLNCVDPERYRIVRPLGGGAQGRVYLARHLHLEDFCVIKTVRIFDEDLAAEAVSRLLNEARAGFRISHPHVARVMDCDRHGESYYFTMEYVDGVDLREVVRRLGPLPLRQVLRIAHETAEGLHAIHAEQIVHRDIKPANLMLLPNGSVKIMDLGVVKFTSGVQPHSVTQHGDLVGTPNYMAAEQFEAEAEIDQRADIYGLGATIFHLLTGRVPYEGTSVLEIMVRQQQEALCWPDEVLAETPRWLREAVERCLASQPKHRFDNAKQLADLIFAHRDEPAPSLDEFGKPAERASRGLVALRFENLTHRPEDDWIGDALAEFLNSRLMEVTGAHVADRHELAGILKRTGSSVEETSSVNQVLRAARLVGADAVIRGAFQHSGETLWITAHVLRSGDRGPELLANTSGPIDELLGIEEQLARKVIDALNPGALPEPLDGPPPAPSSNLAAYEKYIHAKRSFADGRFKEAVRQAEEALALDEDYLDPIGLVGVSAARLGDYDKALALHRRMEQIARRRKDMLHLVESIANTGAAYYYRGEYQLVRELFTAAIEIESEHGPTPNLARLYSNLGFALLRLERADEAEKAFREAINISRNLGMLVSLMGPCNGLGGIMLQRGRHDEARRYYLRTLSLASECGDRVALGLAHMNLGRCATRSQDFATALAEFEAALRELQNTEFWNGLTLAYEHLADLHLQRHDPHAALESVEKRIELARKHGNRRMEAAAWEQRARAHEQMNDTEKALSSLKQAVEVSQRPAPFDDMRLYLAEIMKRSGGVAPGEHAA